MRTGSRGAFIVIEGLDGSGTTTQARILHRRLVDAKAVSAMTCEPTDGPVGKLIRDALSGRLYTHSNEKVALSERTLCLLFAADRTEHSREIEKEREAGKIVVCDRYILSSLAYQTLDAAITPEWVVEVNRGCSIPDLTIFLEAPAEICAKRLKNRKDAPTIYEKRKVLEAIGRNYGRVLEFYSRLFGPVETVDGTPGPQEVHEAIWKLVEGALGTGASP